MLSTAPIATVAIAVTLKPCVEINEFSPSESITNIVPVP